MFHDENLEKLMLGVALQNPELCKSIDTSIIHFGIHRRILKKMTELFDKFGSIDINVLQSSLGEVSASYISTMLDGVPKSTIKTFNQIIARLTELRKKRDLWVATLEIQDNLKKDDFEDLTNVLYKLKDKTISGKSQSLSAVDIVRAFGDYQLRGGGVKIGIPSFDKLTGGIAEGEVMYILGRAKVIKSVFMQNVLSHFTKAYPSDSAIVFSLEMPAPQLGERLLMIESGKGKEELTNLTDEEKKVITEQHRNIFYITKAALSIHDIYSYIIELKFKADIRLAVIDFLTRIHTKEKAEYDALRIMTRFIKDMAKELNIAIIVLTQVSRAEGGDGYSPLRLSSGRGSGTIEEDADFVLGAYRPELAPNLSEEKQMRYDGMVILQMLGSRRTPIINKIELYFNKSNLRLKEV